MRRISGRSAGFLLAALLILAALPARAAGWTNAANLPLERAGHAAVTLNDGKVLVSGGCWGWKDRFTPDCVLYDAASNTWTATGTMATPRSEHGLVVLQDGRVLAAGGFYKDGDQEFYLNSCEIYDPAAGTWSPTGPMAIPRTVFTTTLLSNGKVLVAGGLNQNPSGGDEFLSGAEVYDPAAGTWTQVASLSQARSAHTATRLPNGHVLVVGGASGFTALTQAEAFDHAANAWVPAGTTPTAHAGHTATLLPDNRVLIAGGASGFTVGSAAEIYDPGTATWSTTGSLVKARALHTATLLPNGKVLAAGGGSGFTGDVLKNPMADAELYDPAAGTWSATDPMPFTRSTFTANLLQDGRVLVSGGLWYDGTNYFARRKADIYTPEASTCEISCSASATPATGTAPLTVTFAAGATPTGCTSQVSIAWTFGDGGTGDFHTVDHTYTAPGTYPWTMTASADGQTCSISGTVTVTQAGGGIPGDCNGDGSVSIGEVQKAINMFLGIEPVGCGVDCNGDGSVSIGEVQKVINAFLGISNSC